MQTLDTLCRLPFSSILGLGNFTYIFPFSEVLDTKIHLRFFSETVSLDQDALSLVTSPGEKKTPLKGKSRFAREI